jgi:hypothetical protein
VAAGPSVGPGRRLGIFDELVTRAGSRFRRAEPRRRARALAQRQDTGTAGRIENAQVAVYLGYSAPAGHTLIDRELYLPKSRAGDPERCAAAGIPENTAFATKPQLARRMIERAAAADVAFGWVAGDEVYGDNGPLRAWLEERDIAHVLAVACHHRVPEGAGPALRADELAARLPKRAWQQLPAGEGAKGRRYYDWAWIMISDSTLAAPPPAPRPDLPLPAASSPGTGNITIYGWSTSRGRRRRAQARRARSAGSGWRRTVAACSSARPAAGQGRSGTGPRRG